MVFFLLLCERLLKSDMGHIGLPNNRIVTVALQHMGVLCYKGLEICIYKGLYGNATVLAEKSILLIFYK